MNNYTCNMCQYSTNRKSNLVRHSKVKHSVDYVNNKEIKNANSSQQQELVEYPLRQQHEKENFEYQQRIIELEKALLIQKHTYDKNILHIEQHCYELQKQIENQQEQHAQKIEFQLSESNKCLHQKALEYHNALKLLHKQAQECIDINGMQYQKALDKQVCDFENTIEEKMYAAAYPYSCNQCGMRAKSKIELRFHRKKKHGNKRNKT